MSQLGSTGEGKEKLRQRKLFLVTVKKNMKISFLRHHYQNSTNWKQCKGLISSSNFLFFLYICNMYFLEFVFPVLFYMGEVRVGKQGFCLQIVLQTRKGI